MVRILITESQQHIIKLILKLLLVRQACGLILFLHTHKYTESRTNCSSRREASLKSYIPVLDVVLNNDQDL